MNGQTDGQSAFTWIHQMKNWFNKRSLLIFKDDNILRQHLLIFMLPKEKLIPKEGYEKNPEKYQTVSPST